MAGIIQTLLRRTEAIDRVSDLLSFPWNTAAALMPLKDAVGGLLYDSVRAPHPYPPFSRSLRDGFALRSEDVAGASPSSPAFLRLAGEISMGDMASKPLGPGEAFSIPTGGALPLGADAVVMVEDSIVGGPFVEIGRAVQRGDNVIQAGEDVKCGEVLAERGEVVDFRIVGLLASFGIVDVPLIDLNIGILSTGDEILEASVAELPPGRVRDANSWTLFALLKLKGFVAHFLGIVKDDPKALKDALEKAWNGCDVILISGGSSVNARDYCSSILEGMPSPGLMVRGLNIRPGKPTLIAGSVGGKKRLAIGLPGHPLSCAIVARVVLLPLLQRLVGIGSEDVVLKMPCGEDVHGQAGVEEFVPARVHDGIATPMMAKSGYVGAMRRTDGLIVLPPDRETARKGEEVEFIPW
ncbi:molybdopterin molybdotransferase MoeA [Acetomicrobium sp. S15 = DSM 107314]|uniref:molybdopterin molybdotransferase MoeA n=1 Tax=Acetomicrobium sp. S15 = DSM 107314 TaxID=2529858 RepID=UPI0018E0E2AF|nr:molybdopterin molybdotransferase MoeA [Acetomicrobium sp. S15 = DSM 107314]